MNVLSLFDGISCGQLALQRANIPYSNYYASEIHKHSITVTQSNFPNTCQLGDVRNWREWPIDFSSIGLVLAGSPCQGFSAAGKQGGTRAILNGEEIIVADRETYLKVKDEAEFLSESYLFWEFVLILDHVKELNPNVKFLLENVKMKENNSKMMGKTALK